MKILIFGKIKHIIRIDFVKNVFTLFTGSALSQVILYLTIPVLTRLFSEEAFGVYVLYSSVILISKAISTLRYELTILLPKRIKDAVNLLALNILIVTAISSFLFLVILLFRKGLTTMLGLEELGSLIFFVPLSVFLNGVITALNYWNNRLKTFKNISVGQIGKTSTMSLAQVSTGFSSLKYIGLVPGLIVSQFIQTFIILKLSVKSFLQYKKFITGRRMFYLASKYKDIPRFNTILSFTNILSNELPVILITKYFGLLTAGIYGLAVKVSKAPPGIIGQSISQVFFNEASKVYNAGENIFALIKKTYKNLFLTALFIFIPLFLISFFLDFIFGNEWAEAGIYIRILIPWLFFMFLSSPVSTLITILNKQKVILLYDVLLLIFRFAALYAGFAIYNDILVSLALFSGVGVFFNILILLYFFRISKNSVHQKRAYS